MPSIPVNGHAHDVSRVPDEMPLLWVLRDHLRLTGTKYGCGISECGACTVHEDDRMATMKDAPKEIVVEVVDSEAALAGADETTVPSFAPACSIAIFAATGKRIRDLAPATHDLSCGQQGNAKSEW